MKEINDSPRLSENAATSPVQNSGLFETSTDRVVTPTSQSSVEIANTSDNSNEAPNVSDMIDEHSEIESDSKEEVDTSKECVDGQNDMARSADAEFDQGISADNSIESSSTQEKVSLCYTKLQLHKQASVVYFSYHALRFSVFTFHQQIIQVHT